MLTRVEGEKHVLDTETSNQINLLENELEVTKNLLIDKSDELDLNSGQLSQVRQEKGALQTQVVEFEAKLEKLLGVEKEFYGRVFHNIIGWHRAQIGNADEIDI